ncbi:MAG: endonuclease III domain-containing protein [Candidatus Omnitrophica bacterium]|nr:endonuclease III domain-containing protein [Candidatus Omnitrophota bacterium]
MKKTKRGKAKALLKIYKLLYERFGPRHWWPGDTRLEIIIGAILTQNTAWANVEKAIANLKNARLLKVKGLSRVPKKRLAGLIRPAGYYNIKSQRIKNFLGFLNTAYGGDIKRMLSTETRRLRTELLEVKGIGPETADSILLYAGEKPAFVVDAYTKRIFSRHGFIQGDASYEAVQAIFLSNLPKDVRLFNEFHALIVELGKELCKSKKPLCNKCPIRRIRNA